MNEDPLKDKILSYLAEVGPCAPRILVEARAPSPRPTIVGRDVMAQMVVDYMRAECLTGWVLAAGALLTVSALPALADTNKMELRVFANDTHRHAVLVARLDNLGKGASGAAVQNLKLMLGL